MHICRPDPSYIDNEKIRADLELFLAQPGPLESPPCPGCQNHVPESCSPSCPDAAAALSTDPKLYPIEPKVVPMTFELSSVRLMQTCWSCEGHIGVDGELSRLPKISFYAASPTYSQLLMQHIDSLKLSRKLSYPWHVVLSDYAQTIGITYSIEPDLSFVDEPHLGKLQLDLQTISEGLASSLKNLARQMLNKLP